MRRDYGSQIMALVDSPANELGAMRVIAAAADAIARWEDRVEMKSARVVPAMDGSAVISTVCAVRGTKLTVTADSRIGGRR